MKDYIDKKLFLNNAGKAIYERDNDCRWCINELDRIRDKIHHNTFNSANLLRLKQIVWYLEKYYVES